MTITREINGQVHLFKLTETELEAAYREREAYYDEQDVLLFLEEYENRDERFVGRFGVTTDEVKEAVEYIGERTRGIQDDDGPMYWFQAVELAIREFAEETRCAI